MAANIVIRPLLHVHHGTSLTLDDFLSQAKAKPGVNMSDPTREVIHRAYELWEQAGKPEGRDEEFYHQAERELNRQDTPPDEPRLD